MVSTLSLVKNELNVFDEIQNLIQLYLEIIGILDNLLISKSNYFFPKMDLVFQQITESLVESEQILLMKFLALDPKKEKNPNTQQRTSLYIVQTLIQQKIHNCITIGIVSTKIREDKEPSKKQRTIPTIPKKKPNQ